jgi:hypothetical protein
VLRTLIYRASRDGFRSETFHSRCDNHNSMVVIVKTADGFIFGGYTSISWINDGFGNRYKKDTNAFVFTIFNNVANNAKRYECNKEETIISGRDCGPGFKHYFCLSDLSNQNEKSVSVFGREYPSRFYNSHSTSYGHDTNIRKEGDTTLFAESINFKVAEIEVFKWG